jgi:hypothetical protein
MSDSRAIDAACQLPQDLVADRRVAGPRGDVAQDHLTDANIRPAGGVDRLCRTKHIVAQGIGRYQGVAERRRRCGCCRRGGGDRRCGCRGRGWHGECGPFGPRRLHAVPAGCSTLRACCGCATLQIGAVVTATTGSQPGHQRRGHHQPAVGRVGHFQAARPCAAAPSRRWPGPGRRRWRRCARRHRGRRAWSAALSFSCHAGAVVAHGDDHPPGCAGLTVTSAMPVSVRAAVAARVLEQVLNTRPSSVSSASTCRSIATREVMRICVGSRKARLACRSAGHDSTGAGGFRPGARSP